MTNHKNSFGAFASKMRVIVDMLQSFEFGLTFVRILGFISYLVLNHKHPLKNQIDCYQIDFYPAMLFKFVAYVIEKAPVSYNTQYFIPYRKESLVDKRYRSSHAYLSRGNFDISVSKE